MSNGEGKPEEKEKVERVEYPNIVDRFREVFVKLDIKKHEGYVDHCAKGDLENLDDVEERLFQMGLHPSLRNQGFQCFEEKVVGPHGLSLTPSTRVGAY